MGYDPASMTYPRLEKAHDRQTLIPGLAGAMLGPEQSAPFHKPTEAPIHLRPTVDFEPQSLGNHSRLGAAIENARCSLPDFELRDIVLRRNGTHHPGSGSMSKRKCCKKYRKGQPCKKCPLFN